MESWMYFIFFWFDNELEQDVVAAFKDERSEMLENV